MRNPRIVTRYSVCVCVCVLGRGGGGRGEGLGLSMLEVTERMFFFLQETPKKY